MEALLELQEHVFYEIMEMKGTSQIEISLLKTAVTAISARSTEEYIQNLKEMNIYLTMLMSSKRAPYRLPQLVKMQRLATQVIQGFQEPSIQEVCKIILLFCDTLQLNGTKKVGGMMSLYRKIIEAILVSPDRWGKKDMQLLYNINSEIFGSARNVILEVDNNIAALLEMILELLPHNGNVSRACVDRLNQQMAKTLKITLNLTDANAWAMKKLFQANYKLLCILKVHPDKIDVQMGLLQLNSLLIQLVKRMLPDDEQLVGQEYLHLLSIISGSMMKSFERLYKVPQGAVSPNPIPKSKSVKVQVKLDNVFREVQEDISRKVKTLDSVKHENLAVAVYIVPIEESQKITVKHEKGGKEWAKQEKNQKAKSETVNKPQSTQDGNRQNRLTTNNKTPEGKCTDIPPQETESAQKLPPTTAYSSQNCYRDRVFKILDLSEAKCQRERTKDLPE